MAFLKMAMLKLLFEFDVVTFAQEIMSVQGRHFDVISIRPLTSGLDVRWTLVIGCMTS